MTDQHLVHVGFGEMRFSTDPEDVLVAFGLGSCVALSLYDPLKKLAGVIHIVLPTDEGRNNPLPTKYADKGIRLLYDGMIEQGARKSRLIAKMAGGSSIFKHNYPVSKMEIGARNVEAVLEALQGLKIKVSGQDTGGKCGRTFRFFVGSGKAVVRTLSEQKEI